MAQKFTGLVIVRCNCDHPITGAPIAVTVSGGSGEEYVAGGHTNAFGFFLYNYQRGSRPIDVNKVEGKVTACGQEIEFDSMDIKMGIDWEAVVGRINATRKLPRGFTVDDLKAQVEYFTFTSLDLVQFSNVIEVSIRCHEDCKDEEDTDHGEGISTESTVTYADYRIALKCPSTADEELSGTIWGLGSGNSEAEAQDAAKARARRLAQRKVEDMQDHYRCEQGCTLQAEPTYGQAKASKGFTYGSHSARDFYLSLAVMDWSVKIRCR